MTINPLTMKIKAAKRELLALKTAHTRGLGNVKIYTTTITIDTTGHTTGFWDITFTLDFDQAFTAYPLVNFIATMDSNRDYSMELEGQDYSDGGYTLNAKFAWRYKAGTNSITIDSTSPVVGYSYTWAED